MMEKEYEVITGSASECEKKLNELNKEFHIVISSMASFEDFRIVMAIQKLSRKQ